MPKFNIEKETIRNENYREVVFTGKHMQLVYMSLKPHEEIGWEVHYNVDQFFRIEKGKALIGFERESHHLVDGDAFIVPVGFRHNVTNESDTEYLKLYTIYAPPNHPAGRIQKFKPRETDCK